MIRIELKTIEFVIFFFILLFEKVGATMTAVFFLVVLFWMSVCSVTASELVYAIELVGRVAKRALGRATGKMKCELSLWFDHGFG